MHEHQVSFYTAIPNEILSALIWTRSSAIAEVEICHKSDNHVLDAQT